MKVFQQLLLAPAALGLLSPLAANAGEVNVAGVSDYASVNKDAVVVDQVTSITQFSDVYPTDWAYQALSNLSSATAASLATPTAPSAATVR